MTAYRVPLNDLGRQAAGLADQFQEAYGRVLRRGWFVLGPETEAFEEGFSTYCGVAHTIGVGNGTDALELALRAVGVQSGQSVATVANAGFYTTAALIAMGAVPAFVDVDPRTQLMSLQSLHRVLETTSPRCVVVTHLFGRLADVEAIVELCDWFGVPVVEDCAQAHGARRNGKHAGSFEIAGCFSFYPTKNLGAQGDGGAVVTHDNAVAHRVRALRQYGWERKYYLGEPHGRNSRLDEVQSAILRVKLPHLDTWNQQRRKIASRYSQEIAHPDVECPPAGGVDFVAHLYVICSRRREELRRHLELEGVATDIHYPVPDHRQPVYTFPSAPLPVTERRVKEILTLPCFPEMTDDEVTKVIQAINTW